MLRIITPKKQRRSMKVRKGIRLGDEGDGEPKSLDDARNRSILAIGTETSTFDSIQSEDASAIGTESSTFDSGVQSEDAFESTQIKIQLLGLTNGIVMETTGREDRRIKANKKKLLGDEPVFAVVTGYHEAQGTETKRIIASHLPSVPIEKQSGSKGKKHHLMALWPADFDPNQGTQTSSVIFTRKAKKAPIQSLKSVQQNNTKTRMYTTEILSLSVSLMRGTEIKTVGTVTVHFTGADSKPTQVNLPVKVTKYAAKKASAKMKGEKMKRKDCRAKLKPLKSVSFKGDPTRSYRLDEDSVLSLVIETSQTEDFHDTSIPKPDFSEKINQSDASCLTQHDILRDLVMSSELLDSSDDDVSYDEDSDDEDSDDDSNDGGDSKSNPSDESSNDGFGREEEDFADLASLFDINIEASAKAFFATKTSNLTSLDVGTVSNSENLNLAKPQSVRSAKPGDLPPSSAFSPLSWMPSPRDIAKKFNFSNEGEKEI